MCSSIVFFFLNIYTDFDAGSKVWWSVLDKNRRGVEMKVSIEYCTRWNYLPRASSLEAELVNEFGAEVLIKPSTGGAYEITVDGKKIFSKLELKRFPKDGEIIEAIKAL